MEDQPVPVLEETPVKLISKGPPKNVLETKDRMTVQFMAHHEHHGEQPHSVQVGYSAFLEGMEQPVSRRLQVGPEWSAINTEWLQSPGAILLQNKTGKVTIVQPSPEELAVQALQVLEVCLEEGEAAAKLLVRPGGFLFIEPERASGVRMRCQSGTAPVTVNVYPK